MKYLEYGEASVILATRRICFCAGHRVWGHESKCGHLHGHNFEVEVEAEPRDGQDSIGRVIDFSVLKDRVGGWIETYWDHGFILHHLDEVAKRAIETIPGQKTYYLPYNPTAENLAKFLLESVCPRVLDDTNAFVSRVVVHETENGKAEARF